MRGGREGTSPWQAELWVGAGACVWRGGTRPVEPAGILQPGLVDLCLVRAAPPRPGRMKRRQSEKWWQAGPTNRSQQFREGRGNTRVAREF